MGAIGARISERIRSWPASQILVSASAVALLLVVLRLPFGFSLADEAYYIAMPYRFLLGDKPFIDELMIHQTAGLLTFPLVWTWVHLTGSTHAIVLFMRLMWLAFTTIVAFAAYKFMARVAPRLFAFALAAVYLVFIPFTCPALSYNTLASGFMTIGLALIAIQLLDEERRPWRLLAAGASHGLAVWAYPTLVAWVPIVVICLILIRSERRAVALYLAGASTIGLVFAFTMFMLGAPGLQATFVFSSFHSQSLGGMDKLEKILTQLISLSPSIVCAAAVLYAANRFRDRAPALYRKLVAALPIAAVPALFLFPTFTTLYWILIFGVSGLLLLRTDAPPELLRASRVIVPAGISGGMLFSYTATNGLLNAGLGAASLLLVVLPAALTPRSEGAFVDGRVVRHCAACTAVLLLLLSGSNYIGAEGSRHYPPILMHDWTQQGPWAYLIGTAEAVQVAEDLQQDAGRLAADSTVLFYSPLWGGYVATSSRAAAPSVIFDYADRESTEFDWERAQMMRRYAKSAQPNYVFRPTAAAAASDALTTPLWYLNAESRYRRIRHRDAYDLFARVE